MKPYGTYPPEIAADFIAKWEGFRERAYLCPAGVLTIGYGHTGRDVKPGMVVDSHEAYEILCKDIQAAVEGLEDYVDVDVSEGAFIALTSLAFNLGALGVAKGCPKLMKALSAGDFDRAADEMLDITYAGGRRLPGLVARRQAEAALMRQGSADARAPSDSV